MRLYTGNLQEHEKAAPTGDRLIITKLFFLLFLIYIEPVKKQAEFNRGTIHYLRPIMLSVGILKSHKGRTCIYGIAFFDVLSKFLFSSLVFVGMFISFNSFIAGFISSLAIYFVTVFFSLEESRQTWQKIKNILLCQDS